MSVAQTTFAGLIALLMVLLSWLILDPLLTYLGASESLKGAALGLMGAALPAIYKTSKDILARRGIQIGQVNIKSDMTYRILVLSGAILVAEGMAGWIFGLLAGSYVTDSISQFLNTDSGIKFLKKEDLSIDTIATSVFTSVAPALSIAIRSGIAPFIGALLYFITPREERVATGVGVVLFTTVAGIGLNWVLVGNPGFTSENINVLALGLLIIIMYTYFMMGIGFHLARIFNNAKD